MKSDFIKMAKTSDRSSSIRSSKYGPVRVSMFVDQRTNFDMLRVDAMISEGKVLTVIGDSYDYIEEELIAKLEEDYEQR